MSTQKSQLLKDLVKFFEDRELYDVSQSLKEDLQHNNRQLESNMLNVVRKAVTRAEKHQLASQNTNERLRNQHYQQSSKQLDIIPKQQSDAILERLMTKMVQKPSALAQEREQKLNKQIEKVFELDSFQKMVDRADNNPLLRDLQSTKNFIKQSESIQRSIQESTKLTQSSSRLDHEEALPSFGAVEQDPLQREHDEINNLVGNLIDAGPLNDPELDGAVSPNQQPKGGMMSNDDSFSNIAPANGQQPEEKSNKQNILADLNLNEESQDKPKKSKSARSKQEPPGPKEVYDIDRICQEILDKENQAPGKMMYDPNALHPMNLEFQDEYIDEDDPGFDAYVVNEENFVASCQELARLNNFPVRAIKPDTQHDMGFRERFRKQQELLKEKNKSTKPHANVSKKLQNNDSALLLQELSKKKKRGEDLNEDEIMKAKQEREKNRKEESETSQDDNAASVSVLPKWVKFPRSDDEFYPAEFDKTIYDCYSLRVVFDREKTGFEETKDFPIVKNSIIAGRYQVVEYLGSAAFSKAIQCYDIHTEQMVCMKIIENNKDYFDQSIDEIKLLRFIDSNCADLDMKNLLKVIDYFYHKEHLFIVTELLRDNLYEYSKYNREIEKKHYFNVPRLQKITKQILNALNFIHDLNLIHCDLKPENILIKSYSRSEVKVIDFGSSCFIHDHLSSYVQSRSYRAPEVILGCKYDYKIDMWSLGCILAELFTGYVLFQNDSVQGLLSRVIGIIGPVPEYMMKEGKLVSNFFTREGLIYMEAPDEDEESQSGIHPSQRKKKPRNEDEELKVHILVAKKTTLKQRMGCDDDMFVDFVRWLLEVDPMKRPTAKQAMNHPWLTQSKYVIE